MADTNLSNVLRGTAVFAVFLLIVHPTFPHPLQVCYRVSCTKHGLTVVNEVTISSLSV